MGKRGPQPTPTAILEARGSWLAKAREKDGEVRVPVSIPKKPDAMFDDIASAKWDDLVEHLAAIGVLSFVDEHEIAMACVTWSRWVQVEESLRRRKAQVYPVRNDAGEVIDVRPYPEVYIAARLFDQLLKIFDRFGLSPSSRAGLRTQAVIDARRAADVEAPPVKDKGRFFR